MKKAKFLILGIIVLLMAGALVLASCNLSCPGGLTSNGKGNCSFADTRDCEDLCVLGQLTLGGDNSKIKCNC